MPETPDRLEWWLRRYTWLVIERQPTADAPSPTLSEPEGTAIEDRVSAVGADLRERTRRIRGVLIVVLMLNLVVAFAKLAYGRATGSVALSADGVQSLLDGLANVIGLVGIAVAARPPDRDHPYGHERYETIASIAIAGLMAVGVVEIVQTAFGQLRSGDRPDVTALSFVVLLGTTAINGGVSLWERREGRRWRSDLLLADAKHTASDVLVSASVMLGLLAESAGVDGADAIISLVIAVMIAWAAWGIVREASLVLTDATFADPRGLLDAVLNSPSVVTAHNLRARSSGGNVWVEVHITVAPELTVKQAHEVASDVESRIRAVVGPFARPTIHVEPAEPPHTRPDLLFGAGSVTTNESEEITER